MGAAPVVFDISSDEEPGQEEFEDFLNSNPSESKLDDSDWLSAVIREVEAHDSDEVMVVGEVNPKKRKAKSKPLNPSADDTSDDCVILDGDPEGIVTIENDSAIDGDEVLVVGEKGQVPCRDYPHPRHLCANFSFSSTPHEKHCALCHCHVCDSIAPCVYWGTGASDTDHCHATDEVDTWKIRRKEFQLRKSGSLPAPKLDGSSPTTIRPQPKRVQPRSIIQLAPSSRARLNATVNSTPQNHNFRAVELRPCSTSGDFTRPGILLPRRNQPAVSRGGLCHKTSSHHSVAVRNTVIQRVRTPVISKSGSHFMPSSLLGKRKVYGRGDSPADQDLSSRHDVRPNVNRDLYNHQSSLNTNINTVVTSTINSEVERSYRYRRSFQSNGCVSFYHNQSMDQNVNQVAGFDQDARRKFFFHENPGEDATILLGTEIDTAQEQHSDVSVSWMNDQSEETSQYVPGNPETESRGVTSTHEPVRVNETDSHSAGEFNANPLNLDSLQNWLLDDQPAPLVSDCPMLFEGNKLSAEPAAIDAGTLMFDFETPWN